MAMWTSGKPVEIETERVLLRSMQADDVTDRFVGWFGDPLVMANVAMRMNAGRRGLLRYLSSFDNASKFLFGIWLKDTGQQIGWARIQIPPEKRYGITTTVIGERDYWGRGLGYEIRAAMIAFMFDSLGLDKVVNTAYAESESTHALNQKLGFRRERVLRNHERGHDGNWRDVFIYGLLADEWRARREGRNPDLHRRRRLRVSLRPRAGGGAGDPTPRPKVRDRN
ncbi:MAG: GNAT family protein [Alphaproteobacteria bacterium]|nr:GNAT family protein [Alphaproteobacteria bacterium]